MHIGQHRATGCSCSNKFYCLRQWNTSKGPLWPQRLPFPYLLCHRGSLAHFPWWPFPELLDKVTSLAPIQKHKLITVRTCLLLHKCCLLWCCSWTQRHNDAKRGQKLKESGPANSVTHIHVV